LKMTGSVELEINEEKLSTAQKWDGLKGYLTKSDLMPKQVIDNYRELWHIEKAFRISKHDLKVRPIFHRVQRRIQAHICLAFCSYAVFKELERQLKLNKLKISPYQAIKLSRSIYAIQLRLPVSKLLKTITMPVSQNQQDLLDLVIF